MNHLLLFSCSVVSDFATPWTEHTRLPCPSPSPGAYSNSRPLSQWCHPTISSSVVPFSSCLQSFPVSRSFLMSWLFASGGQSIGASVSVLSLSNEYAGVISLIDWWIQDWLVGFPYSPRDSQDSSPTQQFISINSLAFSLLYGPTLISIHDYWKNDSFDYTDLHWQSNVSAFVIFCLGLS